jgi:hypothetical protein
MFYQLRLAAGRPLVALLAGLLVSLPGTAQTALIAHRSHGGASRTFAAGTTVDNFGRRPLEEEGEQLTLTKVVRLPNGTVLRYGISNVQGAVVDTFAESVYFKDFTAKDARKFFGPDAKLVGFDRQASKAGRPAKKTVRPVQKGSAADTTSPRPAAPTVPGRRRSHEVPVAALPPNHTGPTLLLVLAGVAAGVLLGRWRGFATKLLPA